MLGMMLGIIINSNDGNNAGNNDGNHAGNSDGNNAGDKLLLGIMRE